MLAGALAACSAGPPTCDEYPARLAELLAITSALEDKDAQAAAEFDSGDSPLTTEEFTDEQNQRLAEIEEYQRQMDELQARCG